MSTLTINVGGKDYQIACDEGEEDHLFSLAAAYDKRVRSLSERMGSRVDSYVLVLAGLMLTDELNEAQEKLHQLRAQLSDSSASFEQQKRIDIENAIAKSMGDISKRLEKLNSLLA